MNHDKVLLVENFSSIKKFSLGVLLNHHNLKLLLYGTSKILKILIFVLLFKL